MLRLRAGTATIAATKRAAWPLTFVGSARAHVIAAYGPDFAPMTDLDAIIEQANIEVMPRAAPDLPKQPGLWRVISLLAVLAAVVISTVAILQARNASNVATPKSAPLELETTKVTVADLNVNSDAQLAVLGLSQSSSQRAFDAAGTEISVPRDSPAILALTGADGAVIGLATSRPNDDRATTVMSPRSTARTLMLLSPGMLRADLATTFAQLDTIEAEPAFDKLVEAVRANSNISADNEAVEAAYAEIADRLPAPGLVADQGCSSVIASGAYASAGVCVQPKATGQVLTNEQDRWALLFNGIDDYQTLCAIVAPRNLDGGEALIPSEQCAGEALLVAPGRVVNLGSDQPTIDQRIRTASAVQMLYSYTGPFADLAGASAGFSRQTSSHLRQNATEVVQSLAMLEQQSNEFSAAMEIALIASTPQDRHIAAVSATRLILGSADTAAIIPARSAADEGHLDILSFYQRAGERMVSQRTDWRWDARASGTVNFGDSE